MQIPSGEGDRVNIDPLDYRLGYRWHGHRGRSTGEGPVGFRAPPDGAITVQSISRKEIS